MKRIVIVCAAVACLASCKTTEENYRSSYEAAVKEAHAADTAGVDRETYNKILEQQRPKETAVGLDSVRVFRGYAWQFYGDDETLQKYNVVVGAMKQQFNAKAFCDRLRKMGCRSYVIADRQQNYFVVAAGFGSLQDAAAYLKSLPAVLPIKLPVDEPYVYDTTRIGAEAAPESD